MHTKPQDIFGSALQFAQSDTVRFTVGFEQCAVRLFFACAFAAGHKDIDLRAHAVGLVFEFREFVGFLVTNPLIGHDTACIPPLPTQYGGAKVVVVMPVHAVNAVVRGHHILRCGFFDANFKAF